MKVIFNITNAIKKLLKIIAPLIVVILFTVLYINDSECSLVGAVCMACVIGGLFFFPHPLQLGKSRILGIGNCPLHHLYTISYS